MLNASPLQSHQSPPLPPPQELQVHKIHQVSQPGCSMTLKGNWTNAANHVTQTQTCTDSY